MPRDEDPKTSLHFTALLPWLIAAVFSFFQFFLQTATGVMSPDWAKDFQLDKVELSNLSAAFFYTYIVMQIPAGLLFDRYPPRNILTLAALTLTMGCFLLGYTHNYKIAFLARLLMGIGSSFGFVGLLQMSALSFPANRFALMLGIAEGSAMLGVTGAVIVLTWLVSHGSWRYSMMGCGIITFLLMLASFILIRHPARNALLLTEEKFLSVKTIALRLKLILKDPQVILCSMYGFFMFAIVNAFTSLWGVSFLLNTYSFGHQTAGNMIATIFVGIAIGGPLSGWLLNLMSQRTLLIIGSGLAALTMSVIIFIPHLPTGLLFGLFLLIGLFCASYVVCFAVIKESVNPTICATALATTNMILMLSAPALQLLIGWLLESHFCHLATGPAEIYRFSLGILPLGMVIAFLLAFFIRNPLTLRMER